MEGPSHTRGAEKRKKENEMEFFLPMIPPTVTHHDKELHAFMKDGKPRAVLHDSAELKDARAKLRAHLAAHRPPERMTGAVSLCGIGHRALAYSAKSVRANTVNGE